MSWCPVIQFVTSAERTARTMVMEFSKSIMTIPQVAFVACYVGDATYSWGTMKVEGTSCIKLRNI